MIRLLLLALLGTGALASEMSAGGGGFDCRKCYDISYKAESSSYETVARMMAEVFGEIYAGWNSCAEDDEDLAVTCSMGENCGLWDFKYEVEGQYAVFAVLEGCYVDHVAPALVLLTTVQLLGRSRPIEDSEVDSLMADVPCQELLKGDDINILEVEECYCSKRAWDIIHEVMYAAAHMDGELTSNTYCCAGKACQGGKDTQLLTMTFSLINLKAMIANLTVSAVVSENNRNKRTPLLTEAEIATLEADMDSEMSEVGGYVGCSVSAIEDPDDVTQVIVDYTLIFLPSADVDVAEVRSKAQSYADSTGIVVGEISVVDLPDPSPGSSASGIGMSLGAALLLLAFNC